MTKNLKEKETNDLPKCPVCLERINDGVKKCIHCGSFQDWRKYMSISSSFLALTVALISVLSFSIPVMKKTFEDENSNIGITFQLAEYNYIYLTASNSGTRAGSIGLGEFFIERLNKDEGFGLTVAGRTSGESFVLASASKLIKLYIRDKKLKRIKTLPNDIDSRKCTVKVEITNFIGEKETKDISRRCKVFKEFIKKQIVDIE